MKYDKKKQENKDNENAKREQNQWDDEKPGRSRREIKSHKRNKKMQNMIQEAMKKEEKMITEG